MWNCLYTTFSSDSVFLGLNPCIREWYESGRTISKILRLFLKVPWEEGFLCKPRTVLVSETRLGLNREAQRCHSNFYFLLAPWLEHNAGLIVTVCWTYSWCGPMKWIVFLTFSASVSPSGWKNYCLPLDLQMFITIITVYNERLHRRAKRGNT